MRWAFPPLSKSVSQPLEVRGAQMNHPAVQHKGRYGDYAIRLAVHVNDLHVDMGRLLGAGRRGGDRIHARDAVLGRENLQLHLAFTMAMFSGRTRHQGGRLSTEVCWALGNCEWQQVGRIGLRQTARARDIAIHLTHECIDIGKRAPGAQPLPEKEP